MEKPNKPWKTISFSCSIDNANASVTCETRGTLPVYSNVEYMSCIYDCRLRNFALVHRYSLYVCLSYTRTYTYNEHNKH